MKFILRHTLPFALFCCLALFTPGQSPAAAQKAAAAAQASAPADMDEQNDPNSFIKKLQLAITFTPGFAPGAVSQLLKEAPAGFMHVRDESGLTLLHRAVLTRDPGLRELFKLFVNHPNFTAEGLNVRVCNKKHPYHNHSVLDIIIDYNEADKMDALLNSPHLDQKAVSTLLSARIMCKKNAVLAAAACKIGTKALLLRTLLNHPRVASEIINAIEDDNYEFPESNALHLAIVMPSIPCPERVKEIYTHSRFTQANAYRQDGLAPLHTAVLHAKISEGARQQAYVRALECVRILLTQPRSQHSGDTDDDGGAAAINESGDTEEKTPLYHPHDIDPNLGIAKRSGAIKCLIKSSGR